MTAPEKIWIEALEAEIGRLKNPPDEYCAKCGAPKSNHPYRHPFVSMQNRTSHDPDQIKEAIALEIGKMMVDPTAPIVKATAAAVLELVKPKRLVWEGAIARLENGCYYTAIQSRSGKSWCVGYVSRGASSALGYFPDELTAQAAAQAHADAAHWANTALGVSQ